MGKGELTRERIIAQAAPLFNQRGFAGCSMQDVMEATGLEKGGLYRHFSSKEELAAEAFRYAVARADTVQRSGHAGHAGRLAGPSEYCAGRLSCLCSTAVHTADRSESRNAAAEVAKRLCEIDSLRRYGCFERRLAFQKRTE